MHSRDLDLKFFLHDSLKTRDVVPAVVVEPEPVVVEPEPVVVVEPEKMREFITLRAWRWFVLSSHLLILVLIVFFFGKNFRGKWGHLERRWSATHIQHPTLAIVSAPILFRNFSFSDDFLAWPILPYAAAGHPGRQFVISSTYSWDGVGAATFLGEIDVAVLTVLVLWVSISYSIFAIPNTCHKQYLGELDPITAANLLPVLWKHNWVVVAIVAWNSAGMVGILALGLVAPITPGTTLLCAGSIVWNIGIHLFWMWVGKRTSTLLEEKVDTILAAR